MPAPLSLRLCVVFVFLFWRIQEGEAFLSHGHRRPLLAANPQKKNWQETKKSAGMNHQSPPRARYPVTIVEDPLPGSARKKFPWITPSRASLLAARVGTIVLALSHPQMASAAAPEILEFPNWETFFKYLVLEMGPSLVIFGALFFLDKSFRDFVKGIFRLDGSNKKELKTETYKVKTELKTDIYEVKTELKTDIYEVKTELKTDIYEVKTELKTDINKLKTDIYEVKTELKKDINKLKTELGTARKEIRRLNATIARKT